MSAFLDDGIKECATTYGRRQYMMSVCPIDMFTANPLQRLLHKCSALGLDVHSSA